MITSLNPWPAIPWLWLIESAAFLALLRWSWSKEVPGSRGFRGLVFASALYVTGEGLNLAIESTGVRLLVSGVSFAGIGLIGPSLVFLFADLTGQNSWLKARQRMILNAIGLGLGLLRFADPLLGLLYRSETVVRDQGLFLSSFAPGPAYGILLASLLASMLFGFILVARVWRGATRLTQRHLGVLLIACVAPMAAAALFNLGFQPFGWLDLTPFSLFFTIALTTWAIFHDRLVNVIPIARTFLVENLTEGVIVLDPARVVVDANPAFCRMLGFSGKRILGRPFFEVAKDWPALVEICTRNEPCRVELESRIGASVFWMAAWNPLSVPAGQRLQGFVLTLSDISEQKRDARQLHSLVAERTREWREATDSVLRVADQERVKLGRLLQETVIPGLNSALRETENLAADPASLTSRELREVRLAEVIRQIAETNFKIQDIVDLLDRPDSSRKSFREMLETALDQLQRVLHLKCHLSVDESFSAPARDHHLVTAIREVVAFSATRRSAKNVTIVCTRRASQNVITITDDGVLPSSDHSSPSEEFSRLRMRTISLSGQLTVRDTRNGGLSIELVLPPGGGSESSPGFFRA